MSGAEVVKDLPVVPSLSWDDCRLLVEAVSDYAIFMLDVEGRIATWNLGAKRIKGYEAEEIVGQHFSRFYPEEARQAGKPERGLAAAREHGRYEDEGWRVRKDGEWFWANVIITALRDESGTLRGYGKVTRDQTQRRLAEEQLRQSEERFHHLVDAITDYAVFMLDATGHVETWNAGAENAKGYSAEEIIGEHFSIFYTPEDRAAGRPQQILDAVAREGRFEDESWRVRKDGTRFWANVVITALRDEEGALVGFAKVTQDRTEQRAKREALRRSEERLRLLIESVVDYAIYALDVEGHVTSWNLGAERMKGYSTNEILGKHFSVFFPDDGHRAGRPEQELEVAQREGRFEDEGWRLRKDGSRFWANVVLTALRDDGGELIGYVKITRDLTERREAEMREREALVERTARQAAEASEKAMRLAAERAERAAQRADEANRVKDEFLATVSHELRTPLNAILGYAELLRSGDDGLDMLDRGLEIIHRNAQAQAKIIEDILDVSRIITGGLRLELSPADPQAIVEQAVEVVRPSASAKGIDLTVSGVSRRLILVDAGRLRQVMWNLLSNAVKFTEPGGRVDVIVDEQGDETRLTVRDTGVGLDPAFLPYVFERFRQADSSSTRGAGGLGLGLAIVRHLVELHGGRVDAESAGVGQGATFRVTLPNRRPAEEPSTEASAAAPHAAARRDPSPLTGLRVLVVEDDADARSLLDHVLSGAGAIVETAGTAAAGWAAMSSFQPDVLVSDIGLPGEDGLSFIKRVRALGRARGGCVPAIALTAYTRNEDRAAALAAGFTTHVGKPVEPRHLVAAVKNLSELVPR